MFLLFITHLYNLKFLSYIKMISQESDENPEGNL